MRAKNSAPFTYGRYQKRVAFGRKDGRNAASGKRRKNGRCKNIILSDDSTGIVISGREAREIFGIRSTGFSVENTDGKFSFKVYGFGHGVGLSQNGAVIMADKGYNYREILTHYYSSTDISKTIYKS